ncbi:MAG: metal-dependent hydrolase [Bacteroidetes bacterium]|nr:metal-dependent hydrolase [Bacteroidota bacterium]
MTGKTHLAGGVAAAALLQAAYLVPELSPYVPSGMMTLQGLVMPVVVPGTVVACIAALLPDIDEPQSLISNSPNALRKKLGKGRKPAERAARQSAGLVLRAANVLTRGLAWLVRIIAGGHRAATHVLLIAAVLTAGAWFLGRAIGFPSLWMWFAAGYMSHLVLDMMTPSGLALFWPLSQSDWHLLPSFMRVQTGGGADAAVRVVLLAGAAVLVAWTYGG